MNNQKKLKNSTLALLTVLIILVAFLAVGFASLLIYRTIEDTSGRVVGVNIDLYQENGVTPLTAIDWGDCFPEQSYYVNGWVNNTANYDTVLSMSTGDISPADLFSASHALFTFNGTGQTVPKNSGIEVQYLLTILDMEGALEDVDGYPFSFDITITASTIEP